MNARLLSLVRREPVLLLLLALSVCCAAVAAVSGRDVVTSLLGALLVVAYWLIERLAARIGSRGSFHWAMAVGLCGMVVRLTVVIGGLVVIALLDRSGFLEAIVSFVVVYTIYLGVRLWRFPVPGAGDTTGGLLSTRHRSAR